MIDIAPCASAANRDSARFRIDTRIFYRAQVDDQAIVANPQASRVMSTAADRDKQIVFSPEVHRANDVRHVRTTGNQPRLFVDHSVVDLAGFIVILVTRFDQSATKVCFEIGNRIFVKHIRKQVCFQLDFRPVRRDMIRDSLGDCPRRRM